MAMSASTKDTTALSDAELVEMADLCVDRDPKFDIGFLSKQREEWVLVTTVREGTKLRGYSFCTLERIGGTPSLLLGVALVDRNAKSDQTLKSLLADQFRRALLAFPDEDVLLGLRLLTADGYRAFTGLHDVVPRMRPPSDRRGARLGATPGQAVRQREGPRRPHVRAQLRRQPGRRPRLRGGEGAGARGRRRALPLGQGEPAASASSRSAGRWPRTWPRAACSSSPEGRAQPLGRIPTHSL